MGWPNHFSQSVRNLSLSGCSDPGSVYAMTRLGGFWAMVSLAAIADAAPAENHTSVLGVFISVSFACWAFGDGVVGEHNPAVVAVGVRTWFLGFGLFGFFWLYGLVGFVEVSFLVEPGDRMGRIFWVFTFASECIDVGCADNDFGVYFESDLVEFLFAYSFAFFAWIDRPELIKFQIE